MVAEVDAVTALVVTVNVTLVAPTGTVTLAGTVAAELLLDSVTCAPPAGAGPPSGTVPVAVLPPMTLGGLTASGERPGGGVTVRVAGGAGAWGGGGEGGRGRRAPRAGGHGDGRAGAPPGHLRAGGRGARGVVTRQRAWRAAGGRRPAQGPGPGRGIPADDARRAD